MTSTSANTKKKTLNLLFISISIIILALAIMLSVFISKSQPDDVQPQGSISESSSVSVSYDDSSFRMKNNKVLRKGYSFTDQIDALIVTNWIFKNKANLLDKIAQCGSSSNVDKTCDELIKKANLLKGTYNGNEYEDFFTLLEVTLVASELGMEDPRAVSENPVSIRKINP